MLEWMSAWVVEFLGKITRFAEAVGSVMFGVLPRLNVVRPM